MEKIGSAEKVEEIGLFENTGFLIKIEWESSRITHLFERPDFDFLTHARVALYVSREKEAEVYWLHEGKKRISTRGASTVSDLLMTRAQILGKKKVRRYNKKFACPFTKPICAICEFYRHCNSPKSSFAG